MSPRTYAGHASTELTRRTRTSRPSRPGGSWSDPPRSRRCARGSAGGRTCGPTARRAGATGSSGHARTPPPDGTHPSKSGQQKVAKVLQEFFDGSEFTAWYRSGSAAKRATQSTAPLGETNEDSSLEQETLKSEGDLALFSLIAIVVAATLAVGLLVARLVPHR